MSELVAALVGGLSASTVTLIWESVWKPRRERRAVAAALNAEVGYLTLFIDRHLTDRIESVPNGFHPPMTTFKALASRLGDLPPDLAFIVSTMYAALEEATTIAKDHARLETKREGVNSQVVLTEQLRLAARFYQVLEGCSAGASLAHKGLSQLAPGIRISLEPPVRRAAARRSA